MSNNEDNLFFVLSSAPAWPADRFSVRCSLFDIEIRHVNFFPVYTMGTREKILNPSLTSLP